MLNKLKEYKEFIAILIFFLGGFFWLNNQFPKKTDLKKEVGYLNCIVEQYMTLTQLQLHSQNLEKEAHDLSKKICLMRTDSDDVDITPTMKFELEQLDSDFEHNRKQYRDNGKKINVILDELARNSCKKVDR